MLRKSIVLSLSFLYLVLSSYSDTIIDTADIGIEYLGTDNISINKKDIKSIDFCYIFKNNKNSNFKLEIYNKLNDQKIFIVESNKKFYFELLYESKKNKIYINNPLGEFTINSFNSYLDNFVEIGEIKINNYYSTYRFISLPKDNIFIDVIEGKINIAKHKESLILIAGEKSEIENKKISISGIKDFETARIIMLSKFKAKYDKSELTEIEKQFY